MPDIYINLTYAQYKDMEQQMRAFEESTHGEGTEYYHKSFAVNVGGIRFEFHGPNVKARQQLNSIPMFCRAAMYNHYTKENQPCGGRLLGNGHCPYTQGHLYKEK